jgi:hypothetical protein
MEGFFQIAFTGTAGSGFGMLVLQKGVVVGADVAGASYDGSYTENELTGQLDFEITMNAPAGVTPVQTGIPLTSPISLPIKASLLRDDIGTEKPTLVHTPLGPVNVLFKKIRDFP